MMFSYVLLNWMSKARLFAVGTPFNFHQIHGRPLVHKGKPLFSGECKITNCAFKGNLKGVSAYMFETITSQIGYCVRVVQDLPGGRLDDYLQ